MRPPTNEDLSRWLFEAWSSISSDTIIRSFRRCILGDSLGLHIAQHELYGQLFRFRLGEIMDDARAAENEVDESSETDVDAIDEE